jgi:HEAT repeat protein
MAIPVLIEVLGGRDPSGNAATALGEIGDPVAVPALIKVLSDVSVDAGVRNNAALALRKIGTPEARKAVEEYEKQTKPY